MSIHPRRSQADIKAINERRQADLKASLNREPPVMGDAAVTMAEIMRRSVHMEILCDDGVRYHFAKEQLDLARAAVEAAQHQSFGVQSAREAALESAALDFIGKVDRGEARSSKSYTAFKAALSLPEKAEGWQPIETAPKDQEVEVRGTWKLKGGGVQFTHWRAVSSSLSSAHSRSDK
jgi:hypothetical protein